MSNASVLDCSLGPPASNVATRVLASPEYRNSESPLNANPDILSDLSGTARSNLRHCFCKAVKSARKLTRTSALLNSGMSPRFQKWLFTTRLENALPAAIGATFYTVSPYASRTMMEALSKPRKPGPANVQHTWARSHSHVWRCQQHCILPASVVIDQCCRLNLKRTVTDTKVGLDQPWSSQPQTTDYGLLMRLQDRNYYHGSFEEADIINYRRTSDNSRTRTPQPWPHIRG